MDGQMQSDNTLTWSVVHYNKVICKILAKYLKACRRKVQKTAHFLYSKFKKRHNSFKNWRKVTTPKRDLKYIKTKSCAKFQLNMSKHVGVKCGKLHISYILSSQRGITPSKIDTKWRHSNLICSTLKKSHVNMSKHVGEKCGKRADGDSDGRRDSRTNGDPDGRTDITIP